jgi:hypothetical protein
MDRASIAHDNRMSTAVQVPQQPHWPPEVDPRRIAFKAAMAVEDPPAIVACSQRTR